MKFLPVMLLCQIACCFCIVCGCESSRGKNFEYVAKLDSALSKELSADELSGKNTQRMAQVLALVEEWGKKDPEAALAWLMSRPEEQLVIQAEGARIVVKSWASKDSKAALEWIVALNDARLKGCLLPIAEGMQSFSDPLAAIERAKSQPDSPESRFALYNALEYLARTNPELALEQLDAVKIKNHENSDSVVRNAYRAWSERDPHAAAVSAFKMPVSELEREIVRSIASRWTKRDPEAAVKWGLTREACRNRSAQSRFLCEAYSCWAERSPETVAKNAMSQAFPDSGMKHGIIVNAASRWAKKNPSAAGEWALSVQGKEDRRSALTGAMEGCKNSEEGKELARTLSNALKEIPRGSR